MVGVLRSAWLVAACVSIVAGCGGDDDPCPVGGTGTVVVSYAGLPAGLDGSLTLRGATDRELNAPATLTAVAAGMWTAVVGHVAEADPRIRTVYTGATQSFCVRDGETATVEIAWTPVPTSHRLWSTNGSGGMGALLGFVSEDLATSGTVDPQNIDGPTGGDLAFDRDGGFWAPGATTADAMLGHFDAFALGPTVTPDIEVNIAGIECVPALNTLAFGPDGDLWASSPCAPSVVRLDASALAVGGSVTPSVTLAGRLAPSGLAFDASGNLWVSYEDGTLLRFDASALGASTSTPSRTLTVKVNSDPTDTSTITASDLAFDASGNLWGSDFAGNTFFRIDAADLLGAGAADVVPAVRIAVPLRGLLEGFAFDEGGGLWTTYGGGQLARFAPTQLDASTTAGSPTVPDTIVMASDIGYLGSVAIYPAPAALPLFHGLP